MENVLSSFRIFMILCILIRSRVHSVTVPTDTPVDHSTSGVSLSETVENSTGAGNVSLTNVTNISTTTVNSTTPLPVTTEIDITYLDKCPDKALCKNLGAVCISCKLNYYCIYGEINDANCSVKQNISCIGNRDFQRRYHCRYGYQLSKENVSCDIASMTTKCSMKKSPPESYLARCHVKDDVLCLGNRTFTKKYPCNWTGGYKWSTALALSVTLGGFGVDRFYLGLWRQGMGKLFSFGGLGVWTIVDVILIAVGYVGPHDGSLYIYPWD